MKILRVGILVFDEVEVLDACGPFEVFGVAGRISPGPISFDVTLVAVDQPTVARHGLTIVADHTLEDAPDLDLVVVPGGVTEVVESDDRVLAWLREHAETPTIASVCTGAFVLAEAGLLTTQRVTTHWDDVDALRSRPRPGRRRRPALGACGRRVHVGGNLRRDRSGPASRRGARRT